MKNSNENILSNHNSDAERGEHDVRAKRGGVSQPHFDAGGVASIDSWNRNGRECSRY
jgi:hypothetical protein